jgi:preprotein translocase subunit SecE
MLERLKTIPTFFSEVRAELKKVTFPSRDEVVGTTIVVVVASFVFALFLFLADVVILKAYEGIYRVVGS